MSGARARSARARALPATLAATVVLIACAAGCRVDPDEFHNRVFHCDTAAPDPLCGTDRDGNAMTCFAARQIGGADFCTEACAEAEVGMSLPESEAVCVQGKARLRACDPAADPAAHPLGPCDRREFGCLRTNVLADEGVCVTGSPCENDDDCHDPVRSTCAATFLKDLYSNTDALHANHLYCLQKGCKKNSSSCSPGETCLRDVIPAAANPPDICVPNCDSHLQCPPNHFCFRKISGRANPAVCIPGLLGFVCDTDIDCLLGTCISDKDPVAPLKLCTIRCESDAQCTPFDSQQGRFLCAGGTCTGPDAYRGASCDTTADCTRDPGTTCVRFSADFTQQGTCLLPCGAGGKCDARGGIGHTCLPVINEQGKTAPSCFPGYFGLPCADDAACVSSMTCRQVKESPALSICTTLCANDDDCAKNRFVGTGAYCAAPVLPVCLPLLDDGEACLDAKQCKAKLCTAGKCGSAKGAT